VCGGVASLMAKQAFADTDLGGPLGNNYTSIPGSSPINNNPTSSSSNGFKQLCNRFGINGVGDVLQYNAQAGTIVTFSCSAGGAAPPWQQGQGAWIRPFSGGPYTGRIPGAECAQTYTTYIDTDGSGPLGDNIWPTPVTFAGDDPEDVCDQLQLTGYNVPVTNPDTARTAVIQFKADSPAAVRTHFCGTSPQFNLVVGEALLIRPLVTSTGTPVLF